MSVIHAVPVDPDGTAVVKRTQLLTPSGGLILQSGPTGIATAQSITDNDINPDDPPINGAWLQRLEATCLVAGNAAGHFNLLDAESGGNLVLRLYQPVNPPVVGTRLIWEFPTPLYTQISRFAIQHSAGNLGQWIWQAFGFSGFSR